MVSHSGTLSGADILINLQLQFYCFTAPGKTRVRIPTASCDDDHCVRVAPAKNYSSLSLSRKCYGINLFPSRCEPRCTCARIEASQNEIPRLRPRATYGRSGIALAPVPQWIAHAPRQGRTRLPHHCDVGFLVWRAGSIRFCDRNVLVPRLAGQRRISSCRALAHLFLLATVPRDGHG